MIKLALNQGAQNQKFYAYLLALFYEFMALTNMSKQPFFAEKRKEDKYMQNLEQFFNSVGSNANDIITRLGGSEALVKRFLAKFPSDGNFDNLKSALDNGDTKSAFLAAHTLKGLCANLGLGTLYDKASCVTEHLRGGDITSAKEIFPALEAEYKKVIASLGDFLNQ